MKKRDVIAAVRQAYPNATAFLFPDGRCEILPDGNILRGYKPLAQSANDYNAEYNAWRLALRAVSAEAEGA